jgi:hypothetical protein
MCPTLAISHNLKKKKKKGKWCKQFVINHKKIEKEIVLKIVMKIHFCHFAYITKIVYGFFLISYCEYRKIWLNVLINNQ